MKIAFFSAKPYDRKYFDQANKPHNFTISYFEATLNSHSLSLCQGYDAISLFVTDKLDEKDIKLLSEMNIKLIALRSAGFNHIDIKAAHNHQIPVVRVPAYSPHAVAEHAFALLLTLNRKTHKAYTRIKEHDFSLKGLLGFDLYGKTVGIIGLGNIGQCFADIALGFGMRVLAVDPKPDKTFLDSRDITLVNNDTLLEQSDIISLHCPLTKDNHHMLGDHAFLKMKPGVVIINTGRGALIDAKALISHLKNKKIGGVGLDVYEQEGELFFENHSEDIISDDTLMRLTTFPNVLITSHQGFLTHEAMLAIATVTLDNIKAMAEQGQCDNQL